MARDVTDHVFGAAVRPEEERAVEGALRAKGTLRAMMREALMAYARRAAPLERAAPRDASRTLADGRVVPGPRLSRLLREQCVGCHASGGEGPLFTEALSPDVGRAMLVAVAFGAMPKGRAMDPDDRRRMIRDLVDALFSDPRTRAEALAYFDGATFTLPVHRATALLRRVADRADVLVARRHSPDGGSGARDEDTMALAFSDEARHDTTRFTPAFALSFAYAALRLCKAAGHEEDALDDCLERAAGGDAAMRGGP
jgi:hypothetical protein